MNGEERTLLKELLSVEIDSVKEQLNLLREDNHSDFQEIKTALKEHTTQIADLNKFKWRVIGGAIVFSAIISFVISGLSLVISLGWFHK